MQVERPWIHLLGTDTDVGKTWVCRLLATPGFLTQTPVLATKPIHSGWSNEESLGSDLDVHGDHLKKHPPELLCCYRLELPMSPQGAAELEGMKLSKEELHRWKRKSQSALNPATVFCEGIGGICCPIAPGWTYLDWLAELAEPAILIARVGLGTLNHTIMSARLLKASGIPLKAIVLNEEKEYEENDLVRSNCRWELEQQLDVPIIGPLVRNDVAQNRNALSPLKKLLELP